METIMGGIALFAFAFGATFGLVHSPVDDGQLNGVISDYTEQYANTSGLTEAFDGLNDQLADLR